MQKPIYRFLYVIAPEDRHERGRRLLGLFPAQGRAAGAVVGSPTVNRTTASHHALRVRLLPGLLFLAYLSTTAVLFYAGPWQYPVDDTSALTVFLVLAHLALAGGYLLGVRRRPRRVSVPGGLEIRRIVLVCVIVDLALLLPTSYVNTGNWLPNPAALAVLGEAYVRSFAARAEVVPWANYLRILAAPLLAASVPLGVFYWRRLGPATRWLFGVSVVGTLTLFVSMGANAGAAHWMVLFPWFVLAAHLSGENRLGWRGWTTAAAIQVASVLLFGLLFAISMNVRPGSYALYGHMPGIQADIEVASDAGETESPAPAEARPPSAGTDRPPPIAADAPAAGRAPAPSDAGQPEPPQPTVRPEHRGAALVAADGLAAYLSQGYYAVYLSLGEPFVPMYGVGNSVFLQRQVARLLDDDTILTRPYPVRIEARGWDAYGYWATIYPWIASDVGFHGTILVVFLIGLAFGTVWIDVLSGDNPWAVAFFGQMLFLLYYFPAHNKVMHSGEGVVAFWTLLGLWLWSRHRAAKRTE